MAQFITASIYGKDGYDWNNTNGVVRVFGVNQVNAYSLTTPTDFSGVTCVSAIELLPNGVQNFTQKFYTDKTVAAILAQGNAPLA